MDFPDGAIILHGLEEAFLDLVDGVSRYDYHRCIEILMEGGGELDDFHYNTAATRDQVGLPVFFVGWDDIEVDD